MYSILCQFCRQTTVIILHGRVIIYIFYPIRAGIFLKHCVETDNLFRYLCRHKLLQSLDSIYKSVQTCRTEYKKAFAPVSFPP